MADFKISLVEPETTQITQSSEIHATVGGTNNYIALNNKPKINGVELVGDKTSEELGIAGAEDLTEFVKNTSIDRMYGIMQETNENKTLTLTPINDNEMTNRNSWSWSKYRGVRLSDFDQLLKLGLINNKGTLSEEEKASAQSWLGVDNFVKKQEVEFDGGATRGYVYFIDTYHNQTVKKVQVQSNPDTVPLRNANGNFYVSNPTLPYECTNRGYVDNLFNGANKAVSFVNYSAMITSLNTLAKTSYSVGQNIMIITLSVPDLWVSEIAEESVPYTYVSDDDFIAGLNTNGSVQVGFFKLSALETQKVDLTDYAKISQVNEINTNLTDNYIKNTDYAKPAVAGVVYTNDNFGLTMGWNNSSEGLIRVVTATEKNIEDKTSQFRPITPINLDYAVKVGLTTNAETLTDEEKVAAKNWLGITDTPPFEATQLEDGSYSITF